MIDTVWGLLTIGAVLASVAIALLWTIALRIRDASHVDVAWAILSACAALAYALLADGDVAHRVLAAALASIWGFRLGLYLLFNRVVGKDEDGRYHALREMRPRRRCVMGGVRQGRRRANLQAYWPD